MEFGRIPRIRLLLLAAFASLLAACMAMPNRTEPPQQLPKARADTRTEPMTARWTREQRECEVGNKKKQRRCIMPPPLD